MTGSIIVVNESSGPMHVFVPKDSNKHGHDEWYTIGAGGGNVWMREGWELAAFKNADDTQRAGVYVPTDTTITYRGLNDITWTSSFLYVSVKGGCRQCDSCST
ncbi:hypothetical protein OH77DRAFT_1401835 [Trametes cingulata]|nr:hypothetical protein OH77DRAFT_1401835 [Trametes cingulata]